MRVASYYGKLTRTGRGADGLIRGSASSLPRRATQHFGLRFRSWRLRLCCKLGQWLSQLTELRLSCLSSALRGQLPRQLPNSAEAPRPTSRPVFLKAFGPFGTACVFVKFVMMISIIASSMTAGSSTVYGRGQPKSKLQLKAAKSRTWLLRHSKRAWCQLDQLLNWTDPSSQTRDSRDRVHVHSRFGACKSETSCDMQPLTGLFPGP